MLAKIIVQMTYNVPHRLSLIIFSNKIMIDIF